MKVFHSAEMSRAGESSYSYKQPFYSKHIPLKIEKQSAKGVRYNSPLASSSIAV